MYLTFLSMSKERSLLIKIIYTAIFIALCFAGTFVSIPLGTSKIHLGNLFCVLAGLLCGPLIGGFAGSLGMGFCDLAMGYGWNTYLRSFIIKFLFGFIVGLIFRIVLKKKINGTLMLGIATGVGLIAFGWLLYGYLTNGSGYSLTAVIASSIFTIILLTALIASFWLPSSTKCLLFALVCGLLVNVVGEFFLRILFSLALGESFDAAFITSVSKLPAALFTSIVTIVFALLFFYPLYFATRKLNQVNDLNEYIIPTKKAE